MSDQETDLLAARAAADQCRAGMRDVVDILAEYSFHLGQRGFTRDEAFDLTAQLAMLFWTASLSGMGKQGEHR